MNARFCTQCGAPLVRLQVAGDTHERAVCSACARVSYENPAIHVACIVPGTAAALCCAQLAPYETIQGAALRALAPSAPGEDRLALYCSITDLVADCVCFVFRALEPVALPATCAARSPSWGEALLAIYAGDCAHSRFPVRTGVLRGDQLELQEVSPEPAGAA